MDWKEYHNMIKAIESLRNVHDRLEMMGALNEVMGRIDG